MNRVHTSTIDGFIPPVVISRDLLDRLKVVFPNTLPVNIEISDRELGALIGVQRVIQYLQGTLQNQEDEAIPNVLKT